MTDNLDKPLRLLIADDEQEFASTLVTRLELRNFSVKMVGSGHEAIEEVDREEPDVMLLDLKMPDLDGLEVLARIRENHPDLKVIFLTGHATLEKGIEAVKLGATDFMEKPVDMDKLIEKVNNAKVKRDLLSEKRSKKDIDDLLKKKGW